MWAVLISERELARLLWSKTEDPLRAALMASVLCRQIKDSVFYGVGQEAETLDADAELYEDWAVGLIDQAPACLRGWQSLSLRDSMHSLCSLIATDRLFSLSCSDFC